MKETKDNENDIVANYDTLGKLNFKYQLEINFRQCSVGMDYSLLQWFWNKYVRIHKALIQLLGVAIGRRSIITKK